MHAASKGAPEAASDRGCSGTDWIDRRNLTMHSRLSIVMLGMAVPLLSAVAAQSRAAEVNVTQDPKYRWGESALAVNPKNPDNIVYATVGVGFTRECQQHSPECQMMDANFGPGLPTFHQPKGIFTNPLFNAVAAYSSFDRGKTWSRAILPISPAGHPEITGGGDPYVTAAPDGTFYFSFDANNWGTSEKTLPNAVVGVSKSTDGGRTWSIPVPTGTPVNGPKITADLSTGMIYAASSTTLGPRSSGDVNAPQGKVSDRWLAASKDGVTWTSPRPIGGNGVITAAHGMLATAFKTSGPSMFGGANNQLCGDKPTPCIIFQTTADAGATWTRQVLTIPAGPGPGQGEVLAAADPSRAGHFAISIQREGKEFHVYQTRNSGQSWNGPAIVTDDATKRHYHASLVYSRQGVLGLMWRTMQPAPGQTVTGAPAGGPGGGAGVPYNVWAAISRDGGATFSEPLKVSAGDSPAPESGMFGNAGDDYSTIAIDGKNIYVGWADWRPGERQGYVGVLKVADFKKQR
jgi:hypothetical protein